jgi:hypothetical protein
MIKIGWTLFVNNTKFLQRLFVQYNLIGVVAKFFFTL